MKLELKKVKISVSQSEETTAFTGQLFINDVHAADVSNAGRGGANRVYPNQTYASLVKQADDFCKTLPPVPGDEMGDLPMDLEFWISLEVERIANQKDIEKKQKKNILIGDATGTLTRYFKLPITIDDALKLPSDREYLGKLARKIRGQLKTGEKILNNNIPAELL